jgi:hypothetical protein
MTKNNRAPAPWQKGRLPRQWAGNRVWPTCEHGREKEGRDGRMTMSACRRVATGFVAARPVRSSGHPWGWEWMPFSFCDLHAEDLVVDLELSGFEVDPTVGDAGSAAQAKRPRAGGLSA